MTRFSPKIEIINHFDNLINNVDIDIDSCLENYNDQQLIRELPLNQIKDRVSLQCISNSLKVLFCDSFDPLQNDSLYSWPKTTKVVDYLKQIRMTTIEKLRKAQEEALEYYKLNSSRFKSEINQEKNIDELRSELFAEKFYFQVHFTQSKKRLWAFKIFTFVTDFYMSSSDIDTLEKLVNHTKKPFCPDAVFDEKTVLIALLYKCFFENLCNFPNHIIPVRKQVVSKISEIIITNDFSRVNLAGTSTIDLSKIVHLSLNDTCLDYRRDSIEINIDGLSSLKSLNLGIYIDKIQFSKSFWSDYPSQSLQELDLYGKFSYFNLDNFVNLKILYLNGTIDESFNFELLKNLCNQLESLRIRCTNIDFKTLFKLFDGYNFPYLQCLCFIGCFMKRINKNFINRFPMLRCLYMLSCHLEMIEQETFSNLKQLRHLGLSQNQIRFFGKNAFSNLKNLEVIDLTNNGLTYIDPEFIGLENSVEIRLDNTYYYF